MTFEHMLDNLKSNQNSANMVKDMIHDKDQKKRINYFINVDKIKSDPLTDRELGELSTITEILQILYNSGIDTGVTDPEYDILQERLTDMGIPRLTGSVEINESSKVNHGYRQLRGTLNKIYYLHSNIPRTNKSRKTLDEWQRSMENKYEKATGKKIDLTDVEVLIQPKFDGASCILEYDGKNMIWLTRGDTTTNKASDVSHIMKAFNKDFISTGKGGIKFEVMVSEDGKDDINSLLRGTSLYKNSRQIVTATLNSVIPDFKVDYLLPIPLRVIDNDSTIEEIHPKLIEMFPTVKCKLSDRDIIDDYAKANKLVVYNNQRYRTDGAVITIIDKSIREEMGRDNNINNFEVAYKFTEEVAYTKVKNIEFYVSEFGIITPVLVVNDVIMKGNTVNHISLSNRERFDELKLCYGDTVKVLYDIIPYVTLDENCPRSRKGRRIDFVRTCPKCGHELDLSDNVNIVSCSNQDCISIVLGRILNYCDNLRIQNIGYSTLETLHAAGLLKDGIRSLYKLHKKIPEMERIDGFGRLKVDKIISEIQAKRRLDDSQFMGSIGIKGLSIRTFESVFTEVRFTEMIRLLDEPKLHNHLYSILNGISGIGSAKAMMLLEAFESKKQRKEFTKLLECVSIIETYGNKNELTNGLVVFTGIRPDDIIKGYLTELGYKCSGNWSNKATHLVVPNEEYSSSKVDKASKLNIPVIVYKDVTNKIS